MSADTTDAAEATTDADVHADDHHPTPRLYIEIAVALAVLTAMEVSVSFIEIGPAFIPTLIILMTIKFILVAGWFMHLKFDTGVYTRFMVGGLLLAIFLYTVVLLAFSSAIRV